MTEEHRWIEELLAGYALGSLEGDDLGAAETLLTEHLPACESCRTSLDAFRQVSGDLALAASPVEPPELLLPRLRKEIRPRRSGLRVAAAMPKWLGTVATIAVLGLTAWNTLLNQRLGSVTDREALITDAMTFMNQPGSKTLDLSSAGRTSRVLFAYRPQERHVYLIGTHIPEPSSGDVYELWLGRGNDFTPVHDFVPDAGVVVLFLSFDASRYDEILISEEAEGHDTGEPLGRIRWRASLAPS